MCVCSFFWGGEMYGDDKFYLGIFVHLFDMFIFVRFYVGHDV
jgi:hypothetical protein